MNEREHKDNMAFSRNAGSFICGCASGVFPPLAFGVFLIAAPFYIISKAGVKKQIAFWFMLGPATVMLALK